MANPFRQQDVYQYSNPYRSYGKIQSETGVKKKEKNIKQINITGRIPRSRFSTYYPLTIK